MSVGCEMYGPRVTPGKACDNPPSRNSGGMMLGGITQVMGSKLARWVFAGSLVAALTVALPAAASASVAKPRDFQEIAAQVLHASNPAAAYKALPASERTVLDQNTLPYKTEAVSRKTVSKAPKAQTGSRVNRAAAAQACYQVSTTWTNKSYVGSVTFQYGQTTHECQTGATVNKTWVDGQWASEPGLGWSGGNLLHTWAGSFGSEGRGSVQFQFHYVATPWTTGGIQNPAPCGQIRMHYSGGQIYWINSTNCGLS